MVTLEAPARVTVMHEEAILGCSLGGLLERVTKELDAGARYVDMQFPLFSTNDPNFYAINWWQARSIDLPNGTTVDIAPLSLFNQALDQRGYNVNCYFGADNPDGVIRIVRRE